MSETKTKVGQLKIALVGSGDGSTDTAGRGANADQAESDAPTPKQAALALPEAVKEEKSYDAVSSLVDSFAQSTIEDSKDDNTNEPASEESVTPLDSSDDSKRLATLETPDDNSGDAARDRQDEQADGDSVPHLTSEDTSSTTAASDEDCTTPRAETKDLPPDVNSNSLRKDQPGPLPTLSVATNKSEQPQKLEQDQVQDTPETSALEHETAIDPTRPGCDGADAAQSVVDTQPEDLGSLTPTQATAALPKPIKGDQSDSVDSVADLLEQTTIDDAKDAGDGAKHVSAKDGSAQPLSKLIIGNTDRIELPEEKVTNGNDKEDKNSNGEDEETVPDTPADKGFGDRHYFFSSSGWYYFDDYKNVYFHNGSVVHDHLFGSGSGDLTDSTFAIDGVMHWFDDVEGLVFQDTDGNVYCVDVLPNEQQSDQTDPSQVFGGSQPFQDDAADLLSLLDDQARLDIDPTSPELPALDNDTLGEPQMFAEEEGQEVHPTPSFDPHTQTSFSNDSDGNIQCGSVDDGLAQQLSTNTGINSKCYFYASGRLYYFDNHRNLYSQDHKLVGNGSPSFLADGTSTPSIQIYGLPYWFAADGLMSRSADDKPYRVHTWPSDPNLGNPCDVMGQSPAPKVKAAVPQPSPNPGSNYVLEFLPNTVSASDRHDRTPRSKTEMLAPNFNSHSLQQGLQEGSRPLQWSPATCTSASLSPQPRLANNSRQPSEEQSLFQATEPGNILTTSIVSTEQDVIKALLATKSTPVRRRGGNKDHLRCIICDKSFRRPVALKEHERTHTGEKPEICPYLGCNSGFATKSNMKRHFSTHRVGELEDYVPGMVYQPDTTNQPSGARQSSGIKSGKAARLDNAPYNASLSNTHLTFQYRAPVQQLT